MSNQVQTGLEAGDKQLGSKGHGAGRRQVVGLKRTWLEYGTSDQTQEDMMEVGHEQSGSKEPGGDRR